MASVMGQLKRCGDVCRLVQDFDTQEEARTMTKTALRRQRKQADFLRSTAGKDRRQFEFEWNKRVVSWLYEINRRGALLISGDDAGSGGEGVFEVVEQAERLMSACGVEVVRLIGAQTRQMLTNECCKVVARVYGPAMYKVVTHRWYERIKSFAGRCANSRAGSSI